MNRLSKRGFWRVECETWTDDYADGFYNGTETFQGGRSVPFQYKGQAMKFAASCLEMGDWVKVVHYPSPLEEQERGNQCLTGETGE